MANPISLWWNGPRRAGFFVLLGVALLAAVACGGGDDKGSILSQGDANSWDVSRADELSHAALIQASDLPGSDWEVTDDDFSDVEYPSTAQCDSMTAFRDESRNDLAGRANRSFQRYEKGVTLSTTVNVEVQVHQSAKIVSALLEKQRGMLNDGTLTGCLEAYLRDTFETSFTDVKIDTKATLLGTAPKGAIAYGFDLTLGDMESSVHSEYYVWLQSNAVIQINVNGQKGALKADLINAAIQKTNDAAKQAVAGKSTPQAAATELTKAATATPVATSAPKKASPTPVATTAPRKPSPTPAATGKVTHLSDLKSYTYDVKIEASGDGGPVADLAAGMGQLPGVPAGGPYLMTVSGAFVRPDAARWTIKMGDFEISQVVIGGQEWTTYEGDVQGPYDTENTTAADLSMAESTLDDDFYNKTVPALTCATGKETQNGVSSRKCTADKASLEKQGSFADLMGDADLGTVKTYDVQVWIADAGSYPTKVALQATGEDTSKKSYAIKLELNIRDANKTIDIVPPVIVR